MRRATKFVAVVTVLVGISAAAAAWTLRSSLNSAPTDFAAKLYVGAETDAVINSLGPPHERQESDGQLRLVYRQEGFEWRLQFVDGKLKTWSEKGPYRVRYTVPPPPSSCCE